MLSIFSRKTVYLDREQVLEELSKIFPPERVTKDSTTEEIFMEAGRQQVIDYISRKLR